MPDTAPLTAIPSTSLLSGIRVVELSRHVAGAYCGRLLAQLGAQVTRFGPATDAAGSPATVAVMQRALHDGKTVASLSGSGLRDALVGARLVIVEQDDCDDALAESIAAILARRQHLAADAIVIVISANGSTDGYAPGNGLTSSAWAAMSWAIGEPSREPLTPPYDIVDYETGASAAGALLVALLVDAGAEASPIDVASRDVVAQQVRTLAQNYVPFGRQWQRDGRRPFLSGGIYPLGLFSCKDGHVALYCRSTEQWQGILKAMGDPEWSRAERFKDPRIVARKHGDEADTFLLPWLMQHTKAELMDLGLEYGFPASPVRFVGETLGDPQFAHRGSFRSLTLDDGRMVEVPSEPWRLYEAATSASPASQRSQRSPAAPASQIAPRARASGAESRAWPLRPNRNPAPSRFLEGLRVLDLSWVWSGPLVTSVLADLGAEVIKIEHPSRLDSVRQRGRPIRDGKEVEGPVAELNPWFNQLNHGKRSVVLDIKSAAGKAELLRLAGTCDIIVENMRPGALDKLGLGYSEFARINPSVVMLSMSLVGRDGPLAHMKGYAGIMTSMAGLEALVGHENDDGSQIVVGMAKTALGDPNAAGHAIAVLLAALHRRKTTGRGALIDLSQTDAILSILIAPVIETQLEGRAPIMGNRHPAYAPHGHFCCRGDERWVAISVQSELQWQRLAAATAPALDVFVHLDADARIFHRTAIESALEEWTNVRAQDDVVNVLRAARIPVAPVADYPALVDADWHRRRGLVRDVVHPWIGEQQLVVPPWLFANKSAGAARPAPLLGADTDDVIGSSGRGTESTVQPVDSLYSEMSGT